MGCKNFLILSTVASSVAIFLLAYSPYFLDINPQPYSLALFEKFEKGLEYNERLSAAELLFENDISGPESLALYKGAIYTGTANGDIVKIQNGKMTTVAQLGKKTKSRTLGLRFDKSGLLYFADQFVGLRTLDLNTGKIKNLLPYGKEINGRKIKFPDDLDIDENGIVYMSDASTRWDDFLYCFLEHDNSGRVIAYDTKTGQASVLMDNLHFANGIQLTHDGKALLVAELLTLKIHKFHLHGPKKGQREVFANLPGEPDNIRLSKRGGYWVSFLSARNTTSKNVFDHLSEAPIIRKVIGRLVHAFGSALEYASTYWSSPQLKTLANDVKSLIFALPLALNSPLVIELNEKGEIVQSLHSSDPRWCMLSEVLEDNGYLYLGSFINPYLGKVKL